MIAPDPLAVLMVFDVDGWTVYARQLVTGTLVWNAVRGDEDLIGRCPAGMGLRDVPDDVRHTLRALDWRT